MNASCKWKRPLPVIPTAAETTNIPFVGRDYGGISKQAWQTAVRGRAGMVMISGEAGIGKITSLPLNSAMGESAGHHHRHDPFLRSRGEHSYNPLLTWLRTPTLQTAWKKLDDVIPDRSGTAAA